MYGLAFLQVAFSKLPFGFVVSKEQFVFRSNRLDQVHFRLVHHDYQSKLKYLDFEMKLKRRPYSKFQRFCQKQPQTEGFDLSQNLYIRQLHHYRLSYMRMLDTGYWIGMYFSNYFYSLNFNKKANGIFLSPVRLRHLCQQG